MAPKESGLRDIRTEFVRETTPGTPPSDPTWLLYSDNVVSVNGRPMAAIFGQRGIGGADIVGFHRGPNDDELTLVYHLQKWFTSGGGNALDASYDGLYRDGDQDLPSTHTLVIRQDFATGGADSAGRRVYTVGEGGRIQRVRVEAAPREGEPARVSVTYKFESLRSYVVSQPSASATLTVESSDATDTTQTVTIENDGASTSEGVSLNGTTPVATVASFATIDAIRADAQTKGDVIVKKGSTEIARIRGKDSHGGIEGDLGIPLLGSGSHASAVGSAYERVLDDSIQRGGADLETDVAVLATSFEVNNNLSVEPKVGSLRPEIDAGIRDIRLTATVISPIGSHESWEEHLRVTESDFVWTMAGGALKATGAALTQAGERVYESERAVMQRENVFTGKGITITES